MKSQRTPHYHRKSCNIEIPIILNQVHENMEYHKKRFDKFVKQGIIKSDIEEILDENYSREKREISLDRKSIYLRE